MEPLAPYPSSTLTMAEIFPTLQSTARLTAEGIDTTHTDMEDETTHPPHVRLRFSRPTKLGDLANFWKYIDLERSDYDSDMISALKSHMDNLLIFVSSFESLRRETG